MTESAKDNPSSGLPPRGELHGALPRALAFVLRHAGLVVVLSLAVAALGIALGSKLPLVTDFSQLIPKDTRSVRDQRAAEPYLGNTSAIVVLVEASGQGAKQRAREATSTLAQRMAKHPELVEVTYRLDRDFFERNALLYLSQEQLGDLHGRLDARISAEVMAANPLFVDLEGDDDDDDDDDDSDSDQPAPEKKVDIFDQDAVQELYFSKQRKSWDGREYLTDKGETAYLVIARAKRAPTDMRYSEELLASIDQLIDELGLRSPSLELTLAGNYVSTTEENRVIRRDLRRSGAISLGLLLLIIVAYFRRWRAIWTIFVPLLSGVAVTMGYIQLSVGRLNTVTGFSFALFMGLSIDFAIHLLARYDEERVAGASLYDALLTTYRTVGKAALAAAATSAAGFLALATADFEGFREFGWIASGGILLCLAVIAIQLPAIIALTHRWRSERRYAPAKRATITPSNPRYGVTLSVILVLVAFMGFKALKVSWEDDFRNLRGGSSATLTVADRIKEILGRSTQPSVRIAGTLAEAQALASACNLERDQLGDRSAVQYCVSIADFLPTDQSAKIPLIARITALLTDRRLESLEDKPRERLTRLREQAPTAPIAVADLPLPILRGLTSAEGGKFYMKAYPSVLTWLASNNVRFADELLRGDDVVADDIGPIGTAVIMADLMRVLERDSVRVVVVALGSVLLLLIVLFRSLPRALVCYLPLLIGLVTTVGLMVLLGMRLGFFNMIVIPSIIGIGIDNSIHLLHRYRTDGRGSWRHTIETTGRACVIAAVTTMAGFVGLCFASHAGLRSIGNLAVLGITTCTIASLVVLPAVFGLIERRSKGSAFGLLPEERFDPDAEPDGQ